MGRATQFCLATHPSAESDLSARRIVLEGVDGFYGLPGVSIR